MDEYIHAIHFDTLKVPTVPFQIPTSKTYYGIENMKKGSLDFFKTTVLSKSKEPIFMCSDMPMADMAQDMDFSKKWMFAIAMTLKKGLHLNIIHNIDRPFHEMMLGLESWIPIYMTGQVSPYHLPDVSTDVYHHFTYVSGAFYEKDISYRYEEYLEHVTLTKEFAKTHSNYSIQTSSPQVFRNIQIHILEGNYVMISKVKTPVIHFVIRHPNMVSALEHFTAPVIEDSENIE